MKPEKFYTDLLHWYSARFRSNFSGDTIRLDIDLGLGVWAHNQIFDLAGIKAPNPEGETLKEGAASRSYLRNLLADTPFWVKIIKDPKAPAARLQAIIFTVKGTDSINEIMIKQGYAERTD